MSELQSNFSKGPWTETLREDGFRVVEVCDFESYCAFVNRGFGNTDTEHIWRGQRDAKWEIVSSLARTGFNTINGLSLLARYQKAVARCSNIEYDISEDGDEMNEKRLRLWSLGQHHNLLTPLIDWTVYPYVALFFAFVETSSQETPRAVYALS